MFIYTNTERSEAKKNDTDTDNKWEYTMNTKVFTNRKTISHDGDIRWDSWMKEFPYCQWMQSYNPVAFHFPCNIYIYNIQIHGVFTIQCIWSVSIAFIKSLTEEKENRPLLRAKLVGRMRIALNFSRKIEKSVHWKSVHSETLLFGKTFNYIVRCEEVNHYHHIYKIESRSEKKIRKAKRKKGRKTQNICMCNEDAFMMHVCLRNNMIMKFVRYFNDCAKITTQISIKTFLEIYISNCLLDAEILTNIWLDILWFFL